MFRTSLQHFMLKKNERFLIKTYRSFLRRRHELSPINRYSDMIYTNTPRGTLFKSSENHFPYFGLF